MGANASTITKKINFEDVQYILQNKSQDYNHLLINTMEAKQQGCLIATTTPIALEVELLNEYLITNRGIHIIVYGQNATDMSSWLKYEQLQRLGFSNVYIYAGGMFEWLLLQDIYGHDQFPTLQEKESSDILKYKGKAIFGTRMLKNVWKKNKFLFFFSFLFFFFIFIFIIYILTHYYYGAL